MRKLFLALLFSLTTALFAQQYTVTEVRGQPQVGGQVLTVGQTFIGTEVLQLRIGQSLTLVKDGIEARVAAGANNLTIEAAYNRFLGSRITGQVTVTDTSAVNRTTRQASTASARASDAAGELDLAAE